MYISLPLFCTTITWNFQKILTYSLVTRFMRKCRTCFRSLFFTAAHFHLALVAGSISHFFRRYKLFMLFFQQKSVSFHFLSLALDPCHPFSRWASLACRPLSLFLRLSLALYFKFVDMTIYRLNLSKLNTLANTDTETIFAFLFRLYWLILLYLFFKTLVAMRFPAKITLSCIWVAIPVD